VYFGFGTSVSSFAGGDFGSNFAMRYSNSRYYDNNYYNSYNDYNYYNDCYDDSYNLSPLQVDVSAGYAVSEKLSFEIESSFIWHFNGRHLPEFTTGTQGGDDYIDKYDNSSLYAVPIFATVKYYPFDRYKSPIFLSAGYGWQYTKEYVERVREYYDFSSNYGYYNYSYNFPIAQYESARWLQGFKVAAGISYGISEYLSGEVELRFSTFFPNERKDNSPLTMFKTPNITNIALGTKVYFLF
jgi:hypothetical protein